MNKNDAKVFKALAEAGFAVGHDIPDPELDNIVKTVTSPDEMFLEDVRALFDDSDEPSLRDRLNALLELRSPAEVRELEMQLDQMFASLGLDVEFSRHFIERLLGREKAVTVDEIRSAFDKLKKKYKQRLLKAKKQNMGPGALQDFDTDLNVLFAIKPDPRENDYDLINITVKRKNPDEFHTNTPSGNAQPFQVGSRSNKIRQ